MVGIIAASPSASRVSDAPSPPQVRTANQPARSGLGRADRVRVGEDTRWLHSARAARHPSYLLPAEVVDILHVSPKTVSRWTKEGKLPFMKTLGGHRRYPEAEIRELVETLREEPTG